MGIEQEIDDGVDAVLLVVGDRSHGLFSHGALVGVAGRLVVVRVGNEPSTDPEDREWLDLEVGGAAIDVGLVESDVTVVLLIHVEVLHQPLVEKILELHPPGEQLDVLFGDFRLPVLPDDDVRPTDSAAVRGDEDTLLPVVGVDGDELVESARSPHDSEHTDETLVVLHHAQNVPVQKHQVDGREAELFAGQVLDVLHAEIKGQASDRLLFLIGRDVGHQREVLDQATGFTLRSVRGAEHPPLGGLEGAGPAHLSRLFELAGDAGHVTESGYEGEAGENLGDPGPIHLESLYGPVAGGYGVGESVGNLILAHVPHDVELRGPLPGNGVIGDPLQLGVEFLEEVLEQQGQQLPGELEAFVAVVVLVVDPHGVFLRFDDPPDHQRKVDTLRTKVEVIDGDMRENDIGQNVGGFVHFRFVFPSSSHP